MRTALTLLILVLLHSNGLCQSIWRKTLDYPGGYQFESIDQNDLGELFCLGTIANGPFGSDDFAVSKFNQQGGLVWSIALGDSQQQGGANAIIKSFPNGQIFVAGYSKSSPNSDRDIFYSLLDSNGQVQWSSSIQGLSGHDTPRDLIQLANGNFFIVGSTNSDTYGSSDATVTIIDSNGNILSAYHLGGGTNDHLYSLKELSDGTVLAAGNNQSFDGTHHGWVVRFNTDGQIIEQYLLTTNNFELFMNLELDDEENIYLSGFTTQLGANENPWLVKLNSDITLDWARVYEAPGIDRATALVLKNGYLYQVSNTETNSPVGNVDVMLDIFDLDGNYERTDLIAAASSLQTEIVTGAILVNTNGLITLCATEESAQNQGHLLRYSNTEVLEDCDVQEIELEYTNTTLAVVATSYEQSEIPGYFMTDMTVIDLELEVTDYCDLEFDCQPEYEISVEISECDSESHVLAIETDASASFAWNLDGNTYTDNILEIPSNESHLVQIYVSDTQGCVIDSTFTLQQASQSVPEPLSYSLVACPEYLEYTDHEILWDYLSEEDLESFSFQSDTTVVLEYSNVCGSSLITLDINVPEALPDTSFSVSACTSSINLSEFDFGSYNDLLVGITAQTESDTILTYEFNSGCFTTSTEFHIESNILEPSIYLAEYSPCGNDSLFITTHSDQLIYLDGEVITGDSLLTGSQTVELFIENDGGCESHHIINLNTSIPSECQYCLNSDIYVPNSFTPNNDGFNEVFMPVLNCKPDKYLFQVWSRWGEAIFQTENLEEGWIGNVNGGDHYAQIGVYVWYLEVADGINTFQLKGHVNLIR